MHCTSQENDALYAFRKAVEEVTIAYKSAIKRPQFQDGKRLSLDDIPDTEDGADRKNVLRDNKYRLSARFAEYAQAQAGTMTTTSEYTPEELEPHFVHPGTFHQRAMQAVLEQHKVLVLPAYQEAVRLTGTNVTDPKLAPDGDPVIIAFGALRDSLCTGGANLTTGAANSQGMFESR